MHDHDHPGAGAGPTDELQLLRQLRQLPRERALPADGWARIAARLDTPREVPLATTARNPGSRTRWRWLGAAAMAAAVTAVLVAPSIRQAMMPATVPMPVAASAAPAATLQAQADALSGDYQRALDSLASAPVPADYVPGLQALDASARQIHAALAESPGSTYLLQQLQRTYAQRLELTREAALTAARLTS